MDASHQLMMSRNRERHMEGNKMMKERMQMGMHMQTQMTDEWYSQMAAMHQQMARMHQQKGEDKMAGINERLAEQFGNMKDMTPESEEETERPFNEQGDPAMLNGQRLFTQNCSSCHGNNAQGIGNAFPPLVNTKWITGDKSVPVRIVLHGLQGNIDVKGTTYQGVMPSFKARLSAAEIAAVINYLREESGNDLPAVSQQEVINIGEKYSGRRRPWQANELMRD
jgi:mono/diheme cytochrome c family protein